MSTANQTPALAVTVPARVTINLKGHTSAVVPFTVRDSGSQPMSVTLSAGNLTPSAQAYPGASWVTSISPASFRLAPGQSRTVKLTITVPPGQHGTHYAGIEALASSDQASQVHVGGAVAGTLVLQEPGVAVPVAPPPSPSVGAGPLVIGLGALLVVAAGLVALGVRLRRSRNRRLATIRTHREVASGRHTVRSR